MVYTLFSHITFISTTINFPIIVKYSTIIFICYSNQFSYFIRLSNKYNIFTKWILISYTNLCLNTANYTKNKIRNKVTNPLYPPAFHLYSHLYHFHNIWMFNHPHTTKYYPFCDFLMLGDKIFYCVIGEHLLEFSVELCSKCFIMSDDQCRLL